MLGTVLIKSHYLIADLYLHEAVNLQLISKRSSGSIRPGDRQVTNRTTLIVSPRSPFPGQRRHSLLASASWLDSR